MYMPNVWHPHQGFWDSLNFFYELQTPQDMQLVLGPRELLRVSELRRWQTWSCTVGSESEELWPYLLQRDL